MVADYSALLHAPIYGLLGVRATLTPMPTSGVGPITVTALDKTAGVAINEGVDIQTVRPAAAVRVGEMMDQGVTIAMIDGGTLDLNGKVWRIDMHHVKPSPGGERSGEVLMFLIDESGYA